MGMTNTELKRIITESTEIRLTKIIRRNYDDDIEKLTDSSRPLKILTGIRRGGKSTILKKLYFKLIKEDKIPENNILFLNFEHPLLVEYLNLKRLVEIYDLFMSSVDTTKSIYLFLDEIQNVEGWEKFVRTIYDSTNINIFVTGSNSKLLSSEYTTTLGGRYIELHILPFNFKEFVLYHNLEVINGFDLVRNRNEILGLYNKFLSFGGIPEIIDLEDIQKLNLKSTLIDKILLKDIIERFNVKYPTLLLSLLKYLEKNIGNIISSKNIMNIRDKTLDYDEKTISKYLTYLEQSYLIRRLEKFDIKTKSVFNTQKKYYFTDNIFSEYSSYTDKLENIVYTNLLRKYIDSESIYFGKAQDGNEIDFIVDQKETKLNIQVCSELTYENLARETKNILIKDGDFQNILIYEKIGEIDTNNYPEIKFVNVINWLLDVE